MTPNILTTKSGTIAPIKPLIQPIFCRVGKDFSGTRLAYLNPVRQCASNKRVTTNITNNLRAVNNISVRVMICQSTGAAQGRSRTGVSLRDVSAVAQTVVDDALRGEIDRELTLMERGENIGSNQRRLNRMKAYLNSKPYHVIRNFYAVHMHNPAGVEPALQNQKEPFYTDIIREKSVQETRSVSKIHLKEETGPQPQTDVARSTDAKKIAGQVLEQVEKRMRLDQERRGVWF